MRRGLFVALSFALILAAPRYAAAQNVNATTVAVCGTPANTPVTGNSYPFTQDGSGRLCINTTPPGVDPSITLLESIETNTSGAGTPTNRSITITTGGTPQLVMASNGARRTFYAINASASGTCWGSFFTVTPAANAAGSFAMPPLGGVAADSSPNPNALWVTCPTTGQTITAWESNP